VRAGRGRVNVGERKARRFTLATMDLSSLPLQWSRRLLQLRALGLGFFQDGDVGICFFPEGEKSSDAFATTAAPPSAPTQQTVDRNVWGQIESQSSNPADMDRAPDKRC